MSGNSQIGVALVVLSFALAPAVQGVEVEKIPPGERKAIGALVEKLVELGLPDTAGGEYFVGPAYVQQTFDPGREVPIVPTRYVRIQETVPASKEMIYKSIVPGPHFRLADGRWLLSLGYVVRPDERNQVFTTKLEKRELGNLMKDAVVAHAFQPNADFDAWFEKIPVADRKAMKAGVAQGVPLWQYLELPRNNTTLGVCFLLRAGASDADILCYTIADTRCRDFWRMQPWTGPAPPFDPTGENQGDDVAVQRWDSAQKTFDVEPAAVAFRRDLHRYFFHMLMSDASPYAPEVAASLARATLDEGDPQHLDDKVTALLASVSLPRVPPEDADFAQVLQSWGEPGQKMIVTNSSTSGDKPSITTTFQKAAAEFAPSRKDLPELFALLDDSRPTRWVDFQGSRCVGENALRAIAIVLDENPLTVAGHDSSAPWTKEARQKANASLREWWKVNQRKYAEAP
jgi:hypothetical protein